MAIINSIKVRNNFKDLTGQKFGRWSVIELYSRNKNKTNIWLCECDCGTIRPGLGMNLRNGESQSCGCLCRERHTTHGMSKSPEYRVWRAILDRCLNSSSKAFHNYGERGIEICRRWMIFENFLSDVGRRSGQDYSIERIDNNGGYYPGNVKWATVKEQNKNRRTNRWITFDNKTQIVEDWEREMGFKRHTILDRLKMGWTESQAITTPVRLNHKSITFGNQTKTLTEWSKEGNVSNIEIGRRLRRGWSIEKALTTPTRKISPQRPRVGEA